MENTTGDRQAIVRREKQKRPGEVFAFVPVMVPTMRPRDYPYAVGIATLGEAGYGFPNIRMEYSTYEGASLLADELNAMLDLKQSAAIAIIADTMSRSRFKQDEAAGLTTVKLTQKEITALLDVLDSDLGEVMAELVDKLESALDD